ncbi:MAG: bifunctional (p)ppGpp synthetase/guanosine-3',5'-bis(diphosphate) 3'-pyrophosphohydrolase [Sandaracinaceae bacterium]|nr:bifunctional (p)ppGpp synthetase/guanosine-3',5'-bis(diphosphate) 3'-pyrophosphohydrolase [Sandaracinaceae bacterium]
MNRLPEIIQKVTSYHPGADVSLIHRAYDFAALKHDGQMRRSGDPYFTHPVSVASIIADMRLDARSVAAALLHDVVEDCSVPLREIEERFGDDVAFLVDGVTKLGKVNFASKEDQQAESFRKMLIAMARDIRVLLVKLADRLDNMRTLDFMSPASRERIARETLDIYAPLAARLGIHWMMAELEDLCFKYLHPADYERLHDQVQRAHREAGKYVTDTCNRIHKLLLARGFSAEVSGRQKHLYSIYKKMRRTDREFDQINDFIAFRILTENVSDCYAALGVVHSEWVPVPRRFKDYVALPKPNMYQSLHTTVIGPENRRIEVQIRTYEMHRTAEYGIAAHWQYKAKGGLDTKDAARFAWLRQLVEFQKEVRDPEEFYESVREDLFSEEIFVFTPKGEVLTFPRNATPVDFAYAIHSEVGDRCAGARVNGSLVPLRHKLRNGDVVEIITRANHHPSKDWLNFITTRKARSRVHAYLRQRGRAQGIKLGRDLLEREFRKNDLSFNRFLKSNELKNVLETLRITQLDDLLAQVGYGKLKAIDIVHLVAPPAEEEKRESLRPSLLERTVRKVKSTPNDGVLIEGMDHMLIRFGKCCSPVFGDPITGWITRGRGVTVHRRGCPRAMEQDPARRVEVSWSEGTKLDLPVGLRVTTDDRPGVLSAITRVLSENGLNITEASCKTEGVGRAVNHLRLTVGDLDRLRSAIRGVEQIPGVGDVVRV